MRALISARLSRASEDSMSLDGQLSKGHQWADLHGHDVVADVRDDGVSGDVSPFERPGLGPWLTDRVAEWDVLVAYKLDRLSRRLTHFSALLDWATEGGKAVVVVADSIDTGTPSGLVVAQVLASFAQFERTTIRGRILDAKTDRRVTGRWNGGAAPYGFRSVKHPDGGTVLEPDPELAPVIGEAAQWLLEGFSASAVCDEFTKRGIPTPRDVNAVRRGRDPGGKPWTPQSLLWVFRSRTLLGESSHRGEPVRDAAGRVLRWSEPAIDPETWRRLQPVIAPKTSRRTADTSGALDVLFCGLCGAKMYTFSARRGEVTRRYFRCSNRTRYKSCDCKAVLYDDTMAQLEAELLAAFGPYQLNERVYDPGEDHTAEIEDATGALLYLTTQAAGKSPAVRAAYEPRIADLEAELDRLGGLPTRAAGYRYQPTGQTFADAWSAGDAEARRRLMIRLGVVAKVAKTPDDYWFTVTADPKAFVSEVANPWPLTDQKTEG
jgi:DNA invertase Pin-like site-specific DNA recombinase